MNIGLIFICFRKQNKGKQKMPQNMERIGNNVEDERTEEQKRNDERRTGAKILAGAGFQDRQKEITDSSLKKVTARGEKIAGKNAERRNLAYISRLEGMIEKHGNKLEKRLWEASVGKLIIDPEKIEDGYWKAQEQILRDDGQGRELNDYERGVLTEDIQQKQRESLQSWSNYLGDEQTPYPMWFKVYAWDGMSKMGVFDKKKGEFRKRDEHTVAPYPRLNPAVLGKVYGAIVGEDEDREDDDEGDKTERELEEEKKLAKLVNSGNFNKLYSHFLLSGKQIMKTPERTEDVHGVWKEYLPGDEEALAEAADGTPWCVASPAVGRNYLTLDKSGDDIEDDPWYYDEIEGAWHNLFEERWDEESNSWAEYNYEEHKKSLEEASKAKFMLFHLMDPAGGGIVADNACASIRLGMDGRVAEISGLGEGQALDDALVPIVEEKVKTLPGGEEFLKKFEDKKKLIELDRKMQQGEGFTDEEVIKIFRGFHMLDSYRMDLRRIVMENLTDEDIERLRKKYSDKETLKMLQDVETVKGFDDLLKDIEDNLKRAKTEEDYLKLPKMSMAQNLFEDDRWKLEEGGLFADLVGGPDNWYYNYLQPLRAYAGLTASDGMTMEQRSIVLSFGDVNWYLRRLNGRMDGCLDMDHAVEYAWKRTFRDGKVSVEDLKGWLGHELNPQSARALMEVFDVVGNEADALIKDIAERYSTRDWIENLSWPTNGIDISVLNSILKVLNYSNPERDFPPFDETQRYIGRRKPGFDDERLGSLRSKRDVERLADKGVDMDVLLPLCDPSVIFPFYYSDLRPLIEEGKINPHNLVKGISYLEHETRSEKRGKGSGYYRGLIAMLKRFGVTDEEVEKAESLDSAR